MKRLLLLLPILMLVSSCGIFDKSEPDIPSVASLIPAWNGDHIICSENISFDKNATTELPEFAGDDRLGFCARSMKYLALNRQYGDQTTYFAISAANTGALAATYARLVRRAYSTPTWEFMQQLNLALDTNVNAAVAALEAGNSGGQRFTDQQLRAEQNAVQALLDAHQTADPDGYSNVISDVAKTLNPTNPMLLAAINRNPFFAAYEAALSEMRAEIAGDVDFAQQAHRLKIGAALDRLIKNIAAIPDLGQ